MIKLYNKKILKNLKKREEKKYIFFCRAWKWQFILSKCVYYEPYSFQSWYLFINLSICMFVNGRLYNLKCVSFSWAAIHKNLYIFFLCKKKNSKATLQLKCLFNIQWTNYDPVSDYKFFYSISLFLFFLILFV